MIIGKTCGGCGKRKPTSEFTPDPRTFDGFCRICHTCDAEDHRRRYHQFHPEAAYRPEWQKERPSGGPVGTKLRDQLRARRAAERLDASMEVNND